MSDKASLRGFTVAHQKLSVDVDICRRRLSGWTELTIVPNVPDLLHLKLDARRVEIKSVSINGFDAEFAHRDLLSHPPSRPNAWNVAQHRLYREKLAPLFASNADGDLWIELPAQVAIVESAPSTLVDAHVAKDKAYDPLTVRVQFELDGDSAKGEGINFVGGEGSGVPRSEWHAYTTHSPIGASTSCWLPCVDGLCSLSTWEMEFIVPKTFSIREIGAKSKGDEEDDLKEMVVVCSNTNPNQALHSTDPSKKILSFQAFTPVSSQHVGFAVGPFASVQLSSTYDDMGPSSSSGQASTANASASAENGQAGQAKDNKSTGVPITVYALQKNIALVPHCCKIFVRAMAFFTRDIGSFPFDSYSICFVSRLPHDELDAVALTFVSERLLFPENIIEPLFDFTETYVRGLAAQWCGVNIVAQSWDDIWITEGLSLFITHLFVRRLMGNNEYRFRMRKYRDQICEEDIGQPPIGRLSLRYPVTVDDLKFLRLKAPMVMYILDRRMTKTDRILGITRVLSKLLLQSMSGDLKSQLTTSHFMRICEKTAHHRLDTFFNEWVYANGYPIIRVTQRFNKKRMFIEMGIGQVQSHELPKEAVKSDTYLQRAVDHILDHDRKINQPPPEVFTGPMTIRIHEADGTPYEHVVVLRDHFTKLDIQYNTKYKRLKRSQKYRTGASRADSVDPSGGDVAAISGSELNVPAGTNFIHCLGDVLMTQHEKLVWGLKDWGGNDPNNDDDGDENMFNEAFEWVRVDADFEWLGKIFVGQPDYMYASQLQQDRDVVAQYDAVAFFTQQKPNQIYSTILTRTLMDSRYYHGVRSAAAFGMTKQGSSGMNHLRRVLQTLYCFPNQNPGASGKHIIIPRANDFSDFASYFVQKSVIHALSLIRDPQGRCVSGAANDLLCMLQYNENSSNPYSDSFYIACLIKAIATTLLNLEPGEDIGGLVAELDMAPVQNFVNRIVSAIDKGQRLDRWISSWHNIVTTTALEQDEHLVRAGYVQPKMDKLLEATQSRSPEVRIAAFRIILDLGGYRRAAVLKYVFLTAMEDPDAIVRVGTLKAFGHMLGETAIHGEYFTPSERHSNTEDQRAVRQRAIARKGVLSSVPLVREAIGSLKPLQTLIWKYLALPRTTTLERRYLFELCDVLYEPVRSYLVRMKAPPMYRLSIRRRNDYHMVVRYRSILKKKNQAAPTKVKLQPTHEYARPIQSALPSPPVETSGGGGSGGSYQNGEASAGASQSSPAPRLKLKLGRSLA